jgi:Asp-tRNA(Asn)/Glu-tRNA(Gln) amidotransferase A subunit family amidase
MMDILSLDATDQLQELAALRLSARELLEASVARMDRLPKLNAVVSRDLDARQTLLAFPIALINAIMNAKPLQ